MAYACAWGYERESKGLPGQQHYPAQPVGILDCLSDCRSREQ